jgi:hypothetical protein
MVEQPLSVERITTELKNDHEGFEVAKFLGWDRKHCRFCWYYVRGGRIGFREPFVDEYWLVVGGAVSNRWCFDDACCYSATHSSQSPEAAV